MLLHRVCFLDWDNRRNSQSKYMLSCNVQVKCHYRGAIRQSPKKCTPQGEAGCFESLNHLNLTGTGTLMSIILVKSSDTDLIIALTTAKRSETSTATEASH
jgi:hypothetical protein